MLIKSCRDMILIDQRFLLKKEWYRQFLKTMSGPYLQWSFFLLQKCLVRKLKMCENEGGRSHSDANKMS